MSQSTRILKSKETYSRDEVADLLAALAGRIRSGSVTFNQARESLELAIPDTLRMDIEVTDSPKPVGVKRKLELEMWWIIGADGATPPAGGVTIS